MNSVPERTRDPSTWRHHNDGSLALTRSVKRHRLFRFCLSFDTFIRSMNIMMMAALALQFAVITVYTASSALQRKPASYAHYTDNVIYHDNPAKAQLGEPRMTGSMPIDAYPLSLGKMDGQARVTAAFKGSSKRISDSKKTPLDTHDFHDIHRIFPVFVSSNNATAGDRTKKTPARIPAQHSHWDRDRLADTSPKPQTFQSIDGQKAWLYSAYYDNLTAPGRPLVRLFGLSQKGLLVTVYCHYHHNRSDRKIITSIGVSKPLPESHHMGYKPCYIECSLPPRLHPKSVSVSFQSNSTALPTNQLPVAYPGPKRWNITVCYSVLHTNFSQVSQLIQSIEANRVLGAQHFVLYNHSIASGVARVLYQYQREGLVTVLSWPMPNVSTWYFAQMTALNDCFYRYRKRTDLIVVVDTDELIIPHKHSTWLELIETLDNFSQSSLPSTSNSNSLDTGIISSPLKRSARVGAYQFRSTIFWSEASKNQEDIARLREHFMPEEQEEIRRYNIHLFSHTRRSWRTFSHMHRSKFIARPETVLITGIHYIHNFTDVDIRSINVSKDLGLVHHYRNLSSDTIVKEDATMHQFKQRLYPRLLEKFQMFQDLFP